ncbi:serine protease easter-like [Chironomus tepperi]|uniref:serine protease easter-like n=1 Tax=Chironomus tepperi TaxID=113505 RepID=UPI00391F92D5
MICKSNSDIAYSSLIFTLVVALIVTIILISSQPEIDTRQKCRFRNGTTGICVQNSKCYVREKFTGLYIGDDCGGSSDLTCCLQEHILPEGIKDFEIHENFNHFRNKKCGIVHRYNHHADRQTHDSEFPWIVSLGHINNHLHLKFTCGGSMISEKYILTTAQSVMPLEPEFKLSVIRLKHSRSSKHEEDRHLDIKEFKIIPHSRFDPINLKNDIALIKLDTEIDFESYKITPVCLPLEKEDKIQHELIAIGKKSRSSRRRPRLLVTQVNNHECAKTLNELKGAANFGNKSGEIIKVDLHLTENQICVYKDSLDSNCQDEHGMPLQSLSTFRGNTIWTQHGILSIDYSSCELPIIYTNVRKYLRWIFDNIEQ